MQFFARYNLLTLCIILLWSKVNKLLADQHDREKNTEQTYECIVQCSFVVSFDQLSSFVLPQQCQKRSRTSVCHIELNVDYETRQIWGKFDDHGDHAEMSMGIHLQPGTEMEVREASFNFQRNRLLKSTWVNFCTLSDECDKRYMDSHIAQIANTDKWLVFDNISSLVYSPSSQNLQCHSEETLNVCPNGNVCSYTLNPQSNGGKPDYKCQPNSLNGQMMFFQTHRSKTSSSFSADLKKYDILNYTCNIDNCNSPTISTEIRRLLNTEVEKDRINSSSLLMSDKNLLFSLMFGIFFVTSF